jgi:hypothetical protein
MIPQRALDGSVNRERKAHVDVLLSAAPAKDRNR